MTVLRVVARNHPQQIVDDDVDDRWTPDDIFRPLHAEHGFTIDVAASVANAKLSRFYDCARDGLLQSWAREVVWCNPPYSNVAAWVKKAADEVTRGECWKVVLLLPANRTEQRWWQQGIEPFRDRGRGMTTRNLPGRPRFGTPTDPKGRWKTSCPFGCVVVVFEEGMW